MQYSEGFAAIPNWVIRDESVSIHAVTVYAALASHSGPGGIHPSQPTLAKEARCSESSVRRALLELEALGVVERVRRKSSQGRASNGYVLHPNGRLRADERFDSDPVSLTATSPGSVPVSVSPTVMVPVTGTGGSGQGQLLAPLIEEEPLKNQPSVSDLFDEFWAVYPRKVGKDAARRGFSAAARKVGAQVVLDGARRFAADPNLPEAQFIPHPSTWLSRGSWDDEALPARITPIGGAAPVAGLTSDYDAADSWMAFNR
jgi:hypothetical protein